MKKILSLLLVFSLLTLFSFNNVKAEPSPLVSKEPQTYQFYLTKEEPSENSTDSTDSEANASLDGSYSTTAIYGTLTVYCDGENYNQFDSDAFRYIGSGTNVERNQGETYVPPDGYYRAKVTGSITTIKEGKLSLTPATSSTISMPAPL